MIRGQNGQHHTNLQILYASGLEIHVALQDLRIVVSELGGLALVDRPLLEVIVQPRSALAQALCCALAPELSRIP